MMSVQENKDDFASLYGSPKLHHKMIDRGVSNLHLAQIGFNPDTHKSVLDRLVNHNGSGDDYDNAVRQAVATHQHPDHLTKLADDPHPSVRADVAKYGDKSIHDKLVHDPASDVREAVAMKGSDEHRDKLVHDPDFGVRETVAVWGKKQHHDALVNDPHVNVRMAVAKFGGEEHREKLLNDEKPNVRYAVASKSANTDHLAHLMNDSDKMVAGLAKRKHEVYFDPLTD